MSDRNSPDSIGAINSSTSLSGTLFVGNQRDVYQFTLERESNLIVTAGGDNFTSFSTRPSTGLTLGQDLDNDGIFDNDETITSSGLPLTPDNIEVFNENLSPGTYFLSFSATATDSFQVIYFADLIPSDSNSTPDVDSNPNPPSGENDLGILSSDVNLAGQLPGGGVRDDYFFALDNSNRLDVSFIGSVDNPDNNVTTVIYQDLDGDSAFDRGEEIEILLTSANETASTGFLNLTAGEYGVSLLSTRDNPTNYEINLDLELESESTELISEGDTVYRFLETNGQTQFYTTSEVERDSVIANLPNYEYEGESFVGAPDPEATDITGVKPVYRFFNTSTGVHLYTASEVERDFVIANLPNYTSEGISYYGYESQQEGTVPLYRFYNQSLDAHFYTPSTTERDEFLASSEYQPEGSESGIAFYVNPIEI